MELSKIKEATQFIQRHMGHKVDICLVLGSGLGVLADEIMERVIIPYEQIPHFPESTVEGHEGQLVLGKLGGKSVVAMQGRFHFYEGYSMKEVVFPIRVMSQLGAQTMIVTNAAGGVNESFAHGQLMLVKDHINLMGTNPLIGYNEETLGVRFPDMSNAYCAHLRQIAKDVAENLRIDVKEGVYVGNTGPSYETPAEIRMIRLLGGDAVGMSTVPEVIVARHEGMNVLGISCISNMAAGIEDVQLSHEEVIATTEKVKDTFLSFVKALLTKIA